MSTESNARVEGVEIQNSCVGENHEATLVDMETTNFPHNGPREVIGYGCWGDLKVPIQQVGSNNKLGHSFGSDEHQQMGLGGKEADRLPLYKGTIRRPFPPFQHTNFKSYCIPVIAMISALAFFSGHIPNQLFLPASGTTPQPPPKLSNYCPSTPNWKGWSSIQHAFSFGNSWTTTAFDHHDTQPSPSEPLGNPPFPGLTSSNATNWIGYLTTKYNSSFLKTYNLAVGGATLNNHITAGFPVDITEEIYGRWMPGYAEAYNVPWKGENTLFSMFVGINDVIIMNSVTGEDLAILDKRLFDMHLKLLSSLYGAGARNFLLLNVPPLERIWQPSWVTKEQIAKYGSDAKLYNKRIIRVASALKSQFSDTNVFIYDVHELFNYALDDPQVYSQLRHIKNTEGFCEHYQKGTPTYDYFDKRCGIPVNEYFWLNPLHPTYPIHDVLAEEVAMLLREGPNVC